MSWWSRLMDDGDTHPSQLEPLGDEPLEEFDYYLAVKDKPRRVVNATDEVKSLMAFAEAYYPSKDEG
jgi:hypothetical protein